MFITWDKRYETGIHIIDQQHKMLVAIANKLNDAIEFEGARKRIPEILASLEDYVQLHFRTEEELMKRFSYTLTAEHVHEHQDFADKVAEFKEKLNNDQSIALELMFFLKAWLNQHLLEADKEMAVFLKDKGVK